MQVKSQKGDFSYTVEPSLHRARYPVGRRDARRAKMGVGNTLTTPAIRRIDRAKIPLRACAPACYTSIMSDSEFLMCNADVEKSKALKLAYRKLDRELSRSVKISERNIGLIHTGRQRRAIFLFSKLILHNMSTLSLVGNYLQSELGTGFLDHFSVGALGRVSIDAALMTTYIAADGLTADSWNLRRHILFLHDLSNRKRFLSSMEKAAKEEDRQFMDSYPPVKDNLIHKINYLAERLGYASERIQEFKKGQIVFIDGARGAVREAGWDVHVFDFQQSYLSAHVHSHPVSYMRADQHGIDFNGASDFQLGFVEFVLETALMYTRAVNKRMDIFSDQKRGDPLGHIE